MPRQARQLSDTGIYHIMVRGVNRQRIFEEASDYDYYLKCLREVRDVSKGTVLAYCCMPNHVHLLIEEGGELASVFMKRLGVRYASWYNRKYDRVGHLFQDRFLSRPVEDDPYFLTVLMYIHYNPVAAGLCAEPQDYRWSSRATFGQSESLVDSVRLGQLVSFDAVMESELHYDPARNASEQLTKMDAQRLSNSEAWSLIARVSGTADGPAFQRLPAHRQQDCIRTVWSYGLSVRQMSMLTGLNRNLIWRWRPDQTQREGVIRP